VKNKGKSSKNKVYLVPVAIMFLFALILFLPAGSFRYWPGWVWWSIISSVTLFITAYFAKNDPKLLARRMKVGEKERQPVIISTLSLLSMLAYIVPGLDYRFGWSTVPFWLIIAANIGVLIGYLFIFLVFRENSYASTVIQVEEEHKVVSTGPYAIVRHPMYLGLLLMFLLTPLALGSYWALIPAFLIIPTIVFRITKEETVLRRELLGYDDYCAKTKYRLLPFVW